MQCRFHKELHAVAVRAMSSVLMADTAISAQQAALDYPRRLVFVSPVAENARIGTDGLQVNFEGFPVQEAAQVTLRTSISERVTVSPQQTYQTCCQAASCQAARPLSATQAR